MGGNYDNYNSCSGTFVWSETYKEQDIKQLLATEKTQGNFICHHFNVLIISMMGQTNVVEFLFMF